MEKEKSNLTKKDYYSIIKRSLLFMIPFSIVFILIINFRFNDRLDNSLKLIEKENEKISLEVELLVNYLENELTNDILVIKNSDELNRYINDDNQINREDVAQLFSRLMSSKENFDQIRFLDKDGFEQIRVNKKNNFNEIVDDENLQFKGDRYYFLNSKDLREGELYFSPIDLNVENGEVEIPHKPLFRVVSPIYKNNELFGLVLLNYLTKDIFKIFEKKFESYDDYSVHVALVNEDGYYIYNEDSSKQFAFMFDDVNYKISDEIKDFELLKDTNESFLIGDIFYTISKIKVDDYVYSLQFYLIQSAEILKLPIIKNLTFLKLTITDLIILIITNLLFYIGNLIIYSKNKDKEELTVANLVSDNTNDAVVITDKKTNIIFVNKSFEKITGYNKESLVNNKKTNYFKSGLHSKSFYKNMWKSINENKYWEGELWDKKSNGLLFPKFLKIYAVENKYSKAIQKYVGIFSDLTKEKEPEEKLEKLKQYNIEPNLPNQNLLTKLINDSVNNNNIFGIICFSITNFDEIFINTRISEIRDIISVFVDSITKVMKEDDFIAQISSNTFVVGLLSKTESTEIENLINDFLNYLNSDKISKIEQDISLNIKSGISIYPNDGDNPIDIFKNAKAAMEIAKSENKEFIYSSKQARDALKKKYLMSVYLQNAIKNDELFLNYQPQVNSNNKKIIGAEALLRWRNPDLGLVSPFFFIPIAEESGLIIDIGYWVIEQVFKDYDKIRNDLPKDFKISINVSSVQFADETLFDRIIDLSKKYNVDLSKFELELTESIVVFNVSEVNKKFLKFKNKGLSIALDDFGTGFSSLNYLKDLLIDKIKIDRAFIKDYPEKDNGALVKIIVNISRELGLNLITEGVETEDQLNYIKSIGGKYIQGYYFSKPLNFDDFKEYVKENR